MALIGKRTLNRGEKMSGNGELSRLLTAAVVNQEFCKLLLTSPATALRTGYNGESFELADEEEAIVLSIRATSLTDFARQLAAIVECGSSSAGYYRSNPTT